MTQISENQYVNVSNIERAYYDTNTEKYYIALEDGSKIEVTQEQFEEIVSE